MMHVESIERMSVTDDLAEVLLHSARTAASRAHCPYSKFRVGAAVLCEGGHIVTGCNIENASYGLTVCAERIALFNAVSQCRKPLAVAVTCPDAADASAHYKMPCGACRQVMAEFLDTGSPIIVDGVGLFGLNELLPSPFRL